jgi:hypothetical protein
MASLTTIPRERPPDAPSVADAAERTLEAARRLAEDWFELARLEVATTLRRSLVAAGLLGGALALLAVGWISAAVAAALALARVLELDASVACVALAHAIAGGALLALARKRLADAEGPRP